MKCTTLIVVLSALTSAGATNVSTVPLVLVHGFLGWGPGEMLGFHYWGGLHNFAAELNQQGHDVREAVVGPISSNWDRACELYAYIRGDTVDYGAAHASENGHKRYGRTFQKALYPEWGPQNPIDLLGHSMGGQTIRVLLHLLVEGDGREQAEGGTISPLFQGGHTGWVRSLTTVCAPHDGTTAISLWPNGFRSFVSTLFKGIASAQGLFNNNLPYDFKLDQWGLERLPGEGFFQYEQRVFNSSIWSGDLSDFSEFDLSVEGASVMNGYTKTYSDVYYMSHAAVDTVQATLGIHQVPKITMWFFIQPFALLMGAAGEKQWWQSDGVVNTVSENGPKLNSSDAIVMHTSGNQLRMGVWNFMGTTSGVDHLEMVGIGIQEVFPLYKDILYTLTNIA